MRPRKSEDCLWLLLRMTNTVQPDIQMDLSRLSFHNTSEQGYTAERPTKMSEIAERVGYAALCGTTVGAMSIDIAHLHYTQLRMITPAETICHLIHSRPHPNASGQCVHGAGSRSSASVSSIHAPCCSGAKGQGQDYHFPRQEEPAGLRHFRQFQLQLREAPPGAGSQALWQPRSRT